jgi:hypothetical protein
MITAHVPSEGVQPDAKLPSTGDVPTGAHKKSVLLGQMSKVQMEIRALGNLLKTSTPNAAGLIVAKDIEKLLRAAEKAQMGLQELVL